MKPNLRYVHLYDDDRNNIVLWCPAYLIPLLRHVCLISHVHFERIKKD